MQTGLAMMPPQNTPIPDASPVSQSFAELETAISVLEGSTQTLANRLQDVSVALPEKPKPPMNEKLSRQPCSLSQRIQAIAQRAEALTGLVQKTIDELHI